MKGGAWYSPKPAVCAQLWVEADDIAHEIAKLDAIELDHLRERVFLVLLESVTPRIEVRNIRGSED